MTFEFEMGDVNEPTISPTGTDRRLTASNTAPELIVRRTLHAMGYR